MKLCELKEAARYFLYPYDTNCICDFQPSELDDCLVCRTCGRRILVTDGVIEFVTDEVLDSEKKRELDGNFTDISVEFLDSYFDQGIEDKFSSYGLRARQGPSEVVLKFLTSIGSDEVAFLGCGYGTEIAHLIRNGLRPRRILASDLTFTSTSIVPRSLARYGAECEIVSFTSDLDYCPIKEKRIPIVVYQALHHTPDIHQTVEALLVFGYNHMVFVEPMDNAVIRFFEKMGLARRVEYSGVKPGKLDVGKLTGLLRKHGYECKMTTYWVFPEDYFHMLQEKIPFARHAVFEKLFLILIDVITMVGRPLNFGNFVVCELRKNTMLK